MRTSRNTTALLTATVTAGVLGAATLGMASPASAVVGWEPGYSPSCGVGEAGYVDYASPEIVSRTWVPYIRNFTTKSTAPRTIGTIRVRDVCSGVSDVRISYTNPAGFGYGPESAVRSISVGSNWHSTTIPVRVGVPWNAYGPLVVTQTRVRDRFSSFDLNPSKTMVLWTSPGQRSTISTASRTILVLRNTVLNSSITASAVPYLTPIAVYGTMRNADCEADCGMIPTNAQTVRLQWKQAGATTWSTIATDITDSSGSYYFARKPKASGSYRVTFAGKFASPWLAPASSNVVTVTILP